MGTKFQRPPIPDPMKREIRQRCGFGCVICGLPLYEYEHMAGWAKVKRHVAEEITLLCRQHHGEKEGKLLPEQVVIDADKDPYNKRVELSRAYPLHFSGKECRMEFGGGAYVTSNNIAETTAFEVDGISLVKFSVVDEQLLLTVRAYDDQDKLALKIINNELVYSPARWDVEFVENRLIIRDAPGKFLLDLTFDTPNKIVFNRGSIRFRGVEFVMDPEFFAVLGSFVFFNTGVANCSKFMSLSSELIRKANQAHGKGRDEILLEIRQEVKEYKKMQIAASIQGQAQSPD